MSVNALIVGVTRVVNTDDLIHGDRDLLDFEGQECFV